MNNPPLSQKQILSLCGKAGGFSNMNIHFYYENHKAKLEKLINKGLIRFSKRLGDNGKVYEAI